jgi:hypothetical protein
MSFQASFFGAGEAHTGGEAGKLPPTSFNWLSAPAAPTPARRLPQLVQNGLALLISDPQDGHIIDFPGRSWICWF